MPKSIYQDGTYLASNPTWHAEDSPWKARQVLKMLKAHDIRPETVGEVGCGAGEILRQLSLSLPETSFSGFDVSEQAIEFARSRESDSVQFFNLDICDAVQRFDVLLLMDVVEHVEDCFGLLRAVREKAEYKIIHIPLDMSVSMVLRNRIMDVRRRVGHVHYFTKDTALAILRETGYQVIDYFYTPAYEIAKKDVVHQTMATFRHFASRFAPDLTATLLGGCPLLVLAK